MKTKYVFLMAGGLVLVTWMISWGIALYTYRLKTLSVSVDYILEYHNPNGVVLFMAILLGFFGLIGWICNPRDKGY